jgi:AraC-like DNA-binding protein
MWSVGPASAVNVAPKAIVDACASAGVAEEVLQACGTQLRTALGRHSATRLPVKVVNQLWSEASRRVPTIGLAAALRVPFGAYLMYDAALATSATVGDALSLAARHHGVLNSAIELRLEKGRRGQLDVWFCQSGSDLVAAEYLEYVLVNTIRRVRIAAGVMWTPVKVQFPRRSATGQFYERTIGAPVAFDGDAARLTVPAWVLARKPVLASPDLCTELERRLRVRSVQIEDAHALIARLSDHCARCPEGEPLDRMAREVARSRRTIQRRLYQHGQSYRGLRDAVRRDAALDLLVNTRQTCEAIAAALGFSEPSAFSRAFRKWTGRSPGAYRRDQ